MTIFSGSGPGAQTSDGCSVELYAQLPYRGDLDVVIACLSPGSTVLELGCGAGQGTRALLDAGMRVTAIDNSSEMLAHCPAQATLVCSDIAMLNRPERFDAVILPTGLINHVDAAVREEFVACARRHADVNGSFFVQRQNPQWLKTVVAAPGKQSGGIGMSVESVERSGNAVSMTLRYSIGMNTWVHNFKLAQLETQALQNLLSEAGFGKIEWLDQARTWLRVRAVAVRPDPHFE